MDSSSLPPSETPQKPQKNERDERLPSEENPANIGNFAPVARIMKTALPDNAKIAKEAKECMQECVSEFISFITSEGTSSAVLEKVVLLTFHAASEKCQQEKRKTVNGEDILFAMTSLGFENYGEALKIYLARYREVSSQFTVNQISLSLHILTPNKNLVARGEHQKPAGAGGPATSVEGFDPANHAVLSNPLDPSVEGGNEFYGHPGAPEY